LDFFLWKSSDWFLFWPSFICHWILWSLIFWGLCIFWLLIFCQMHSWQRFIPILWTASSIWWLYLLFCRSFLISCSTICQSFLLDAEPLEFSLGSHRLCLLIPVYSLFFPTLAIKF
jgi:hypothetical protein